MASKLSGWILDVYPDPGRGVVVWFIGSDNVRYRFTQTLAVCFYVGGNQYELDVLCTYLERRQLAYRLLKRSHLFRGEIEVIEICVANGASQRSLFRTLQGQFPKLEYYNADLALPIHYFSITQTYPLCFCLTELGSKNEILTITPQDDKWSLKPVLPKLRLMDMEPISSPIDSIPASIRVTTNHIQTETLSTKKPVWLLQRIRELLEVHDPDVVRTRYGDRWLFPYLFSIARSEGVSFNPNRDKSRNPIRIEKNQFESYGRLVHRDQQTLLLGRVHLDPQNSMAFKDWGLLGTIETARLSNLPLQNAARRSAGGAFIGMQVAKSLEKGILIPIRKQQHERFKSATSLIAADNGGVIYKPITGLHDNVAEIDFFSMYPHIMTGWNISAETVGQVNASSRWAPGIGTPISQDQNGIVADILKPILDKRRRAKEILESGNFSEFNREYLQTTYEFLKGLGWVSYGYQGFSGNRIGSIEAHEAINAVSRDVILHAKEAAEEAGYEVLHLYVDSLFIRILGHEEDLNYLLEEIKQRTGLKADLEGIFNWIAFLPSKQNQNVPVPNCYFGVFRDGEIKCRGIMARRADTPDYIKAAQLAAISLLTKEKSFDKLASHIPELVKHFRQHYTQVTNGLVSLDSLKISQTLSRDVEDLRVNTPARIAAFQMIEDGTAIGAGQNVDFLRIKKPPFVLSWHRTIKPDHFGIDIEWYCEQLIRAADEVLQPLGVPREVLDRWLKNEPSYWRPKDFAQKSAYRWPLLRLTTCCRNSANNKRQFFNSGFHLC